MIVNNQIKKGLSLSVDVSDFLISEYLAKLQGRAWLSHALHFARLANTLLKDDESERDNHVFADNFAKYSPILTSSYCQNQQ